MRNPLGFVLVVVFAVMGGCSEPVAPSLEPGGEASSMVGSPSIMTSSTSDSVTWDANDEIVVTDSGSSLRLVHETALSGFTAKVDVYKDGVYKGYVEPQYSQDWTTVVGYRLYAANLSPGSYTDHDATDATVGYSSNLQPVDSCEGDGDLVGCCEDQDGTGWGGGDDGPGGDCSTANATYVGTFALDGTLMTSESVNCAEEYREKAANATFRAGIGFVLGAVAVVAAEAFGGPVAAKWVAEGAVVLIGFEIDNILDNLAMMEHCLSHH